MECDNSRKATHLLTPKTVAREHDYVLDRVREKEVEREIGNIPKYGPQIVCFLAR